jgi:hypothetical protein
MKMKHRGPKGVQFLSPVIRPRPCLLAHRIRCLLYRQLVRSWLDRDHLRLVAQFSAMWMNCSHRPMWINSRRPMSVVQIRIQAIQISIPMIRIPIRVTSRQAGLHLPAICVSPHRARLRLLQRFPIRHQNSLIYSNSFHVVFFSSHLFSLTSVT